MTKHQLEQAAIAAGIAGDHHAEWDAIVCRDAKDSFGRGQIWRPHRAHGDAFALALALNMTLSHENEVAYAATSDGQEHAMPYSEAGTKENAMMQAIVAAAAEQGRRMVVDDSAPQPTH